MVQRTYPGHCLIGNTETTKRKAKNEIIRMLGKERQEEVDNPSWLVMFQGKYQPEYWIVLLIRKNALLDAVDSSLRDIWLECCGHLSSFYIMGTEFQSNPKRGDGTEKMDIPVGEIFCPGLSGEHLYDYGDSTYLTFKVLDLVPFAPDGGGNIELVGQNDPSEFPCSVCGKVATIICQECLYEHNPDNPYLCDDCFEEHECEEEMSLPVVNSPRSGQCGYEG